MAKIVIVKPVEERRIRVSLEITPSDLKRASYFDPKSTNIFNEEGKVEFIVMTSEKPSHLGNLGLAVNQAAPKNEKLVFTQSFDKTMDKDAFTAFIANMEPRLTTIEKQVKDTIKKLSEIEKTIEEV